MRLVVVFGLTLWLSFMLARFVNFVLNEDVFPRIQMARGVPYAISNLARYSLLFFGFFFALAAAGIELSRLTFIAGGLGVGIGFGLHCEGTPLGANDRTLWWAGWGGSMCVVDVANRMTVAYAMNRMRGEGDLRAPMVIFAAHAARAER